MEMKKAETVAEVLFAKIRSVAAEDVHLRKTLLLVRGRAQRGLRIASGNGASAWREALEQILELTDSRAKP
jgi:hypothetical protein